MNGKRRLRARLAVLYACLLLGSGLLLLIIADLPLTTFGRAQAHTGAGRSGPVRSFTNLPEVVAYSAVALAVLAVVSLALGWLVADRALRPLRVITAAARAASASSLDERLSVAGAYEEFRELGDTLNGLFARLEAAFESQRHFVANASHELRTPLAATRTVLQVALADPSASAGSLRAACQQVIQLGEQQEHLVDALLTLATGQSGLRHRTPFDLAEVTARMVASRQQDADHRGLNMAVSLSPAVVTGDPALAESLVANLVDNAVRHNVPGGHVRVATERHGGRPRLSVANSGPVVPPGEVGRLLEPFQQLDGERTGHAGGHGLGMAIVAAVARAHAADLAVRARPEGGLDVTVTFRLLALPVTGAGQLRAHWLWNRRPRRETMVPNAVARLPGQVHWPIRDGRSLMDDQGESMETMAVHGGERRPGPEGSVVYPIYQGTVYSVEPGTDYHDIPYIRMSSTPSQRYLHDKLAALEGAQAAVATASGMSAVTTTLLSVLRAGDHLLASDVLYGGTHDFLTHHAEDLGWRYTFVDVHRPETWAAARTPQTRAFLAETITNPLMRVGLLREIADFGRREGVLTVIDNTFATPVNFRPLQAGFDLCFHSATKYLGGHSDLVAGAVMGSPELIGRVRRTLNHFGGSLDPHAGFLLARGIKTLALRVRAQNGNATALAGFLAAHPQVAAVNYPGLASHPDHRHAAELLSGFGGVLSLRLRGGEAAAEALLDAVKLPFVAPSLGGVETLITRPATTSHAGMSPEDREGLGITDDLIRVSCGIEGTQDLIADFDQALAKTQA